MANTIDIKFSGLINLRAAKYPYRGTKGDDCLRALGTNFYNSTYVYNSTLLSGSSITGPGNAFDRDETTTFATITSSRQYTLQQHRIRPQTMIIVGTSNNSANPTATLNISLEGFNEAAAAFNESLGPIVLPDSTSSPATVIIDNLTDNDNLRRGWVQEINIIPDSADLRLYQLYLFGEIVREDQDSLPPTVGATTIEAFTDSFIESSPISSGTIIKDGNLTVKRKRSFSSTREVLIGTYTIPDESEFSVINIDPNGSNRIVNLPKSPVFNHYLRINNVDGGFQLEIRDSDATTVIQLLSNAAGPNTLEAVWSGTQWIVTT